MFDSLIGLGLGAGVGILLFRGHWADLPLDRLKLSVSPGTRNGPGLSFAIWL